MRAVDEPLPASDLHAVTLRFHPSPAELTSSYYAYAGRSAKWAAAGGLAASAAAVAGVLTGARWCWTVAGASALFGVLMFVATLRTRRIVRDWVARSVTGETVVDLDPAGITWRVSDGSWTRLPLRMLLGTREAPNGTVLVLQGGAVLVLPRAAIADDVRPAVESLLARLPRAPSPIVAVGLGPAQRRALLVLAAYVLLMVVCVVVYQLLMRRP